MHQNETYVKHNESKMIKPFKINELTYLLKLFARCKLISWKLIYFRDANFIFFKSKGLVHFP